MKLGPIVILTVAVLFVASMARSGHELPVYPSYYPHEIEITTVAPEQAVDLVRAGKLHAYVGDDASFAPAPSGNIGAAESLGSLVVVRINPQSLIARNEATRCPAMKAIVRDIVGRAGAAGVAAHPYPVTPWHGDYLSHADRAEDARQTILAAQVAPPPAHIKVRADGALARRLARPEWLSGEAPWDVAIEEIGVSDVVTGTTRTMNGWLGPRWVRSGWFHAYRVLGSSVRDPAKRQQMEAVVERLQGADYQDSLQRINLERELVDSLVVRCDAAVVGYTAKKELFNTERSAGIENISFDALEGFLSPMFLRTVKLKDYPWNGSLRLAVPAGSEAAWNPVGGFTGPFGRLTWFAVSDPALIPSPYEAAWILNRISEVEVSPRP
jgi:hypothetical protein